MERSLDRSVVSESLLKSIDPNKPRLPNPDFELVPPDWRLPCNADSTVPVTTTIKQGLQNSQENEEPVRQKPKLSPLLKNKQTTGFISPFLLRSRKRLPRGLPLLIPSPVMTGLCEISVLG